MLNNFPLFTHGTIIKILDNSFLLVSDGKYVYRVRREQETKRLEKACCLYVKIKSAYRGSKRPRNRKNGAASKTKSNRGEIGVDCTHI